MDALIPTRPCEPAHTMGWKTRIGDFHVLTILRDILAEQSVVFLLHDSVAFARGTLQRIAIQHRDGTPNVFDEALLLEMSGGYRDAFSADAEHVCDEVVRHDQLVRSKQVVVDEEPPAELLFNRM